MTSRTDFSDAEWERLGRAPLLVALAVSIADPGGPIETFKESRAALQTILEAAQDSGSDAFVQEVARDVAARAQQRQNPMGDFRPPKGGDAREAVLDELRAVNALLLERATPEEADAFREYLRTAAQRAALAAKEGGFLGFHAERVSEREQEMLEQLGAIFGS